VSEAAGDSHTALLAWRGVRGSILATRSLVVPFEDRLVEANARIAELMADIEGDDAAPGAGPGERRAWHLERLERSGAPSAGWTLAAIFGLGMWIGGGALFAVRGVTAAEKLNTGPAAAAGILVALGLVIWLVGLAAA
jgi:hypothetical protein